MREDEEEETAEATVVHQGEGLKGEVIRQPHWKWCRDGIPSTPWQRTTPASTSDSMHGRRTSQNGAWQRIPEMMWLVTLCT